MDEQFTISFRTVRKIAVTMLAALLAVAGLPLMNAGQAAALTYQIQNRSVQMSDSSPYNAALTPGSVGSGDEVTYQFTFTPLAGSPNVESLVIDFCNESPIIGDTCTGPTGMTFDASPAPVLTNVSGVVNASAGWTLTTVTTGGAVRIELHNDANSAHDIVAGTTQIFNISGMRNPTQVQPGGGANPTYAVGTFFGRILGFANNSYGTFSTPAAPGNYVDYGGAALSTTSTITITAKVEEQLTFCVTAQSPLTGTPAGSTGWTTTHNCADPVVTGAGGAPALTLGSGNPALLSAQKVDTGYLYSQLSTNATHGAVVNMHSNGGDTQNASPTCAGLSADFGNTCAIPPINGGSAAGASAMTAGNAAFGLFVSNGFADSGLTGATGTVTPMTEYHASGHAQAQSAFIANSDTDTWYGMDGTSSSAANTSPVPTATYSGSVISTYGSTVAYATAPTYGIDLVYQFAATPSLTTPAGVYQANLSMIATGQF